MDTFGNLNEAADPYVVCGVGNHISRTTVHLMTQNPEWTREEGEIGLPVTQPSDELHVMVFDHDKRIREKVTEVPDDIVGRVWPPIHVRDLDYGVERQFELQLHDVGDYSSKFDYSAADEAASLKRMGEVASNHQTNRGTIRLKIRFDIEPVHNGAQKPLSSTTSTASFQARRRLLRSYMSWPRIRSKPIEVC